MLFEFSSGQVEMFLYNIKIKIQKIEEFGKIVNKQCLQFPKLTLKPLKVFKEYENYFEIIPVM